MESNPTPAPPVLDMDAIPGCVWESLAAETARFIRGLLRDQASADRQKGGERN